MPGSGFSMVLIVRRFGVWQTTALLVLFIVFLSIILDIGVHKWLEEPLIDEYAEADTLIATMIATPITYVLLRMLVTMDVQNQRLAAAAREIRTLEGLLPMCSGCKKVRCEAGEWHSIDVYLRDHTRADITHGLCPDCATFSLKGVAGNNR